MARTRTAPGAAAAPYFLERHFGLRERRTDLGTEVRAGLTTFMVMSYIIVVNAVVITSGATIAGLDVSVPAVVTSTCLVAGLMTLAMGLWANLPFALAPGMGINAVVAFQLLVGTRYTFAEAMGVILLEGIIITILVLTGLRQKVLRAVPIALKMGIGAGIGLFLFAIGAYEAGFFVVPMNALLQHRGHHLVGAGRSIAVQNFNENTSILIMIALYSLLLNAGFSIYVVIVVFGLFVAGTMTVVQLWYLANRRKHPEEVERLLAFARAEDPHKKL